MRCSLMFAFLIFFGATAAYSETPISPTDEIVVTARRSQDDARQLPANITVLTAKELSRLPARNAAEALNLVSGVDIQFRGQVGQTSSITIQGSQASHVRIMVDGVLMNSQGMAYADPSQIPIENVERIEIIKGSGSSVWGSSLGGVVNIITKQPQTAKPFLATLSYTAAGGDYKSYRNGLEVSGKSGQLAYLFWMNNLDSNNEFRSNSALSSQKLSAKANYTLGDSSYLEGALHYAGSDMGGYEFPALGYSEDLEYFARYGSLKFFITPDSRWEFSAIVKASNQDNRLEDFDIPTATLLANVASKNVFTGLDLQSTYKMSENQTLSSGADLGRDSLESDLMNGRERFSRQGYYANYLLTGDELGVNLGARYDDNEAFGSQFSPSAGLVYRLAQDVNLRVLYSKAFNAPPLVYKYINTITPNPDLKAERALAVYETSLEARPQKDLWLKAAYYRSEVDDLVVYDFPANMMKNISAVRRQGIEAETRYQLAYGLQSRAGCALNRVQDRDTGAIVQGNGVAKLTYNLGLNYTYERYNQVFNVGLNGNYRFWNGPALSNPNDRKFIWDLKMDYQLNQLTHPGDSLFLAFYNIFNQDYWYDELLPMPGKTVEFGVKYTF